MQVRNRMWKAIPVRIAGCVAMAACVAGCVILSPSIVTIRIKKQKSFLIARSEASRGWGYLSHPLITPFSSSNVLLTYNYAGDWKGDAKHKDVVAVWPALSGDGGATWQLGREAVGEETMKWLWTGSITDGADVYVYQLGVNYPCGIQAGWFEQGRLRVLMTNVTIDLPPDLQPAKGAMMLCYKGVRQSNGDLVLTAQGRFGNDTKSSVIALHSTNQGASFSYLSTVAAPANVSWVGKWSVGFEGPGENSIVGLPNGDLLCVMRVGVKQFTVYEGAKTALRMLQARSSDGGRTWRRRCLPIEGVSPKLLRLSNGVLVLAFGRPGNSLAFSSDGGRIWGREIAITAADINTTGYCDIMEVAPGRMLVVYDAYNTDAQGFWLWEPKEVNGVFGQFVTVHRMGFQ